MMKVGSAVRRAAVGGLFLALLTLGPEAIADDPAHSHAALQAIAEDLESTDVASAGRAMGRLGLLIETKPYVASETDRRAAANVRLIRARIIPRLIASLAGDEATRRSATLVLPLVGHLATGHVDMLRQALKSEHEDVRKVVLDVFYRIRESSVPAIDDVAMCLDDPDPELVRAAAVALASMGEKGRASLLRGLPSNSPVTRGACFALLCGPGLAAKEALALVPYLRSKDDASRGWAAKALCWYMGEGVRGPKNAEVIAALVEALGDRDAAVREQAAVGLRYARTGLPKSVVPRLASLMEDRSGRVREAAAGSTVTLGADARCYPHLVAALDDANDYVRYCAVLGLGQLGAAATGAAGELRRMAAEDLDPRVRRTAQETLKAIGAR